MAEGNNKRIAKNTLYMYLRMLVMLFVSLFTARVVYNTLGVENYGVYNVVAGVILFFSFINNGLAAATNRFITAELAKGSANSQRNIFNLAVFAHVLISLGIFLLAETVGLWGVNYLLNIPESRMFAANVVYQLSVVAAILGVLQSPFSSVIIANERMSIYAYFTILDVVFKLLIIYLVQVIMGDKLIVYGILVFVVGLVDIMVYRIYCYRSFPMCKMCRPHGKEKLKEMFNYMGWSLAGQGTVVLTYQGVSTLVNIYFSVVANAAMGVSNTITNTVNQFVSNFQVAFNPQITKYYVAKEMKELNTLAQRASRYSGYLVLIFLLPICLQIKNVLTVWLGEYPEYAPEFCVLTLVDVYIAAVAAPLWMIMCSDSNIKNYQIVVSSILSLNFFCSWLFLYLDYPPYVVIIIRILVNMLVSSARLIMVKNKIESFDVKTWLTNILLIPLCLMVFPFLVGYALLQCEYSNIWWELIVVSGVSVLLMTASIFFIGLTKRERLLIKSKILRKK